MRVKRGQTWYFDDFGVLVVTLERVLAPYGARHVPTWRVLILSNDTGFGAVNAPNGAFLTGTTRCLPFPRSAKVRRFA